MAIDKNEILERDFSTIHGVLISIFNTGVLLTGKSGIGKSETAIELVFRGHKLVSDDAVELSVSGTKLYGKAPDNIRHLMEIRGVGIIDVKALYGKRSVMDKSQVELVIELEKWDDDKNYDRLGKSNLSARYLDIEIPKVVIPVDAGRNLAIVIEVAVRKFIYSSKGSLPSYSYPVIREEDKEKTD